MSAVSHLLARREVSEGGMSRRAFLFDFAVAPTANSSSSCPPTAGRRRDPVSGTTLFAGAGVPTAAGGGDVADSDMFARWACPVAPAIYEEGIRFATRKTAPALGIALVCDREG